MPPKKMLTKDGFHKHSRYGIPITVGVTGHRDLRDPDAVRATILAQFASIQNQFPSSPLYAVSALAEGADRIFAHIAIEMGWELHVVLPMRPELYRADFTSEGSEDEFDVLCRASKTCMVMPIVVPGTEDRIVKPGLYRNLQYASAGIYLARRSHILFALWDGKPAVGLGGTAQIVSFRRKGALSADVIRYKEDGLTPEILNLLYSVNPLEDPETGLVAIVYCARETQLGDTPVVAGKTVVAVEWTDGSGHSDSLVGLLTAPDNLEDVDNEDDIGDAGTQARGRRLMRGMAPKKSRMRMAPVLNELNEINRDIERRVRTNPSLFDDDWGYKDVKEEFRTACLDTKVILDNIVSENMNKSRFGLGFVFVLIGCFVLLSSRSPGDPEGWVMISTTLSLILLAILALLTKVAPWAKNKARAIHLRAIVQGLAVQDFWNIAGIRDGVFQHYMRYEGEIVRSTRFCLQGTGFANPHWDHSDISDVGFSQASTVIEYVRTVWIGGQIKYYNATIRKKELRKKVLELSGKLLFFTGISFLFLTLLKLYEFIDFDAIIPHGETVMHMVEHGSETFVALGAVVLTYLEFVGDDEDAETYEKAREIFRSARAEITRNLAADTDDMSLSAFQAYNIRATIHCLGVDILNSDTARWVERSLKQKIDLMKG